MPQRVAYTMKFGVCVPNYGATSSVEAVSAIALEAEALGYDSVWTTDHVLMPRNSGTPYERILDSIATLAYLAPQTRNVRLGVSSLIIAMRNPAVVAKQLASIDAFSGGRVLLAIGVGWNQREFTSVGSDFHDRGRSRSGSSSPCGEARPTSRARCCRRSSRTPSSNPAQPRRRLRSG